MTSSADENESKFSVLMSVYSKETSSNLDCALNSIFNQTRPPDEVILVKDGPLSIFLEQVIEKQVECHPQIRVVSIEQNVGLGSALQFGLEHCTYELVARMDSDDVCSRNRFAIQVPIISSNKQLSVIGSWVEEFEDNPNCPVSIRRVPEGSRDIRVYAQTRCPVNHPTVIFRKSHVKAVGGYNSKYLYYEDYSLWVRLLMAGYYFYNVQSALVFMRTGDGFYKRRGGLRYLKAELNFFVDLFRIGFIRLITLIENVLIRLIIRLLPSKIRKYFFIRCARGHS